MKSSSKMIFFLTTLTSTIIVMNSSTWISMWVGLEMNLMSFIPLISTEKNPFSSQSIMMYFLIQSMASMMFMSMILANKFMWMSMSESIIKNMLTITMMIKMGMPPFHMWFPEIMNKMSWKMCILLMTWQKIAPMYIISLVVNLNKMLIIAICLSTLTGAIGGINQTSTRKILAYSSMNHVSWMIASATTYKKSWMFYMLIYSLLMVVTTMLMYEYNIMSINQMNIFFKKNMEKLIIILLMMSIGGLPPFLGFIPKWVTIQNMISSKEFIMMTFMTTCALITLSYYLRMTSSMNMIMSHSQKWMYMFTTNKKISTYILLTNLLLPLSILMMNFF